MASNWEVDLRQARSSPKGGNRACLCPDEMTYSKKCCNGTLWAQGIGNITGRPPRTYITTENFDILITQNSDNLITQNSE